MGLRFSLQDANNVAWLLSGEDAHLAAPWEIDTEARGNSNSHSNSEDFVGSLIRFLEILEQGFRSSPRLESYLASVIHRAIDELRHGTTPTKAFRDVKEHFSHRPWTALIVPSGVDPEVDESLCSDRFLRKAIGHFPEGPGLVLQLTEGIRDRVSLTSPFPAFKTALARQAEWPGLLVWSGTNSTFLSSGSNVLERARFLRSAVRYLDEWVYQRRDPRFSFVPALPSLFGVPPSVDSAFHLIQFSDIHIGAATANERMARLRNLVRQLGDEYGRGQNVLPVISGDIIDTPSGGNWGLARSFVEELKGQFVNEPFFVRGNHDCRSRGFGRRTSLGTRVNEQKVAWFDTHRVGVIGFDSCDGGSAAAGRVSPAQLDELGGLLDAEGSKRDYNLIGVVHHHPMPVPVPPWLKHRDWWRLLKPLHEPTVAFEDANHFHDFVSARQLRAVIHGHKHIPRETSLKSGIPLYGAGSATGMIETDCGRQLVSINIVSLTPEGRVSCRFHLEDTFGGGKVYEREYLIRG